jgi:hypothetical protein
MDDRTKSERSFVLWSMKGVPSGNISFEVALNGLDGPITEHLEILST